MKLRIAGPLCVTLVMAAVGCGGSNSVDLLGDASDQDATTGDDGSAGDAGDLDASNGGDATLQNDGSSGFDAAYDGPATIAADGGAPLDSGPGGSTSSITCGATTCSIPAETCCVYPVANPPPSVSYACAVGSGCPAPTTGGDPATALKCSSAVNCPANTVCCVSQVGNTVSSACQSSCTNQQAQLCDPNVAQGASGCAADAGACSNSQIGDWGLPKTFGTCGGKGN